MCVEDQTSTQAALTEKTQSQNKLVCQICANYVAAHYRSLLAIMENTTGNKLFSKTGPVGRRGSEQQQVLH